MPTARGLEIARAISDAMGRRPVVRRMEADHFPGIAVDILLAEGWPLAEASTAITLDLAPDQIPGHAEPYEVYLVAGAEFDVAEILGDVGVRVRRGSVVPEPDEFILNAIQPLDDGAGPRHVYALDPPILPLPVELGGVSPHVRLLQLVPFTDSERVTLEREGRESLKAVLRSLGPRLVDLRRS